MEFMTQSGLFALGFSVGMVGTVLGVGGGFFLVPFLMLGLGFTPQLATGTSLAIIFICGVSGSITYIAHKKVLIRIGLLLAAGIVPGAFVGTHVNQYFNKIYFELFFTLFLLGILGYLYFRKVNHNPGGSDGLQEVRELRLNWWIVLPLTCVVGVATTLLGIGGGIVFTPILAFLFRLSVPVAVATSYFVLTLNGFAATLSSLHLGHVHFVVTGVIGAGGILGAQVGARLASRVRPRFIKNLLLVVLLVLTASLIYDSVRHWILKN